MTYLTDFKNFQLKYQRKVFLKPIFMPFVKLKELLKSKVPEDIIPSAFDIVGDIAIFDSKDPAYDKIIAEGILKLHKNVKVVAKRGITEGVERIRPIEVIIGENRSETVHIENGFRFKLDLNKVFFNTRLQFERQRVIDKVEQGELVFDLFAGVGPFAIPIAKKGAKVVAIDINPHAIKYLKENIKLNKVPNENIEVYQGDCREVVNNHPEWWGKADRIIMNLPAKSEDFLDVAKKLANENTVIHFYWFCHESELWWKVEEVIKKVFQNIIIIEKRKIGERAPRVYKIVVDFKLNQ